MLSLLSSFFFKAQDGLYSNKPSIEPQNFDKIAEDSTFLKIRQFPVLGLEFEAESEQLLANYFSNSNKQSWLTSMYAESVDQHGFACRGQLVLFIPYSILQPSGSHLWRLVSCLEGQEGSSKHC